MSSIIDNDAGVLTLNYILNNDKKINYQIQLVTKASNLGKGLVCFLFVPLRADIAVNYILSMAIFNTEQQILILMYEKQIEPKILRVWNKAFGAEFNDHLYFELHKKYFKRFYNGKITKRYARIRKKLNQRDEVDLKELKILFT